MKRILNTLSFLTIISLIIVSCKKEYTCACNSVNTVNTTEYSVKNGQQTKQTTKSTIRLPYEESTGKVAKKNAEKSCGEKSGVTESTTGGTVTANGYQQGSIVTTTIDVSCTLK